MDWLIEGALNPMDMEDQLECEAASVYTFESESDYIAALVEFDDLKVIYLPEPEKNKLVVRDNVIDLIDELLNELQIKWHRDTV